LAAHTTLRQIYDVDPCHKFAWCMDACVRDHIVEERRIKEMQTTFVLKEIKPFKGFPLDTGQR